MPVRRTKSVGTKVTDGEYAMLERLAGERPMSEWVRQVLLSVVTRHPVEEVLVAELLALRTFCSTCILRWLTASRQQLTPCSG